MSLDIEQFLDSLELTPERRTALIDRVKRSHVRQVRAARVYGADPLRSPADFAVAMSKGSYPPAR